MRPKSEIYTPKRDDEHPHHFHMRSPPRDTDVNDAKTVFTTQVLQLNCKTQLMERDALNQQHVTQCYAIALIKSRRSLLVVGKTTG